MSQIDKLKFKFIEPPLQSPFSYVCWLHRTLTNKGFQNGCSLLEDVVHILSAMTD